MAGATGRFPPLFHRIGSPPGLIPLDIKMPGIDSVEVCRRLKAQGLTRDIPVIFSTAKNEIEAEQRGLDLRALAGHV